MKTRIKIITLICAVIILIFVSTYYNLFVYGSHVPTDSLYVVNAAVNGSTVTITGNTACSGTGFAGYDTVWVVNDLWIRPRYSIVSKFNPSGTFEISYDIKDRRLHKVFLVGAADDDKKQIWLVVENEGTIPSK